MQVDLGTDTILYHGSTVAVNTINLALSNPKKDFGAGFYTSTDLEQTIKFARIKAQKENSAAKFVSEYRFISSNNLVIKTFESPTLEWLQYILEHRLPEGKPVPDNFDIVIGPIANDQVGVTINLLLIGAYGDPQTASAQQQAIGTLLPEKLAHQVVFKTQKSIELLSFIKAEEYEI